MGSGKSGLYNNTAGNSKIAMNLTAAFKRDYDYNYHDGMFGRHGRKDAKPYVRHILSPTPEETAKDFYARLTKGGTETVLLDNSNKIKGYVSSMGAGTSVTYRMRSTSDGSPAVDINISSSDGAGGIKSQKIHFVLGERK